MKMIEGNKLHRKAENQNPGTHVKMSLVNVWQEQHQYDPQVTLYFTEERNARKLWPERKATEIKVVPLI